MNPTSNQCEPNITFWLVLCGHLNNSLSGLRVGWYMLHLYRLHANRPPLSSAMMQGVRAGYLAMACCKAEVVKHPSDTIALGPFRIEEEGKRRFWGSVQRPLPPPVNEQECPTPRNVLEGPYVGGGGVTPPPPLDPPPPLPMFEADSQNFASAPSAPRGFKLKRPSFGGDHRGALGGEVSQPNPPPPDPPPRSNPPSPRPPPPSNPPSPRPPSNPPCPPSNTSLHTRPHAGPGTGPMSFV